MRPLAVDIDGTLTDDERALDPRVVEPLREWAADAPVVVATGKAFPYPVALCDFLGIPTRVVAENGGVAYLDDDERVAFHGDREAAQRVLDRYVEAGHSHGWGQANLTNRWRETELAVSTDQPLEPLREFAAEAGMRVFDTGYAYHVTSPDVDKGNALRSVADRLGVAPESFVAVGDSENDVGMFELAGDSFAVANADDAAKAAADTVVDGAFADGFLDAIDRVRE